MLRFRLKIGAFCGACKKEVVMNIIHSIVEFFKKLFKKKDADSITVNGVYIDDDGFLFEKVENGNYYLFVKDCSVRLLGNRHFASDSSDRNFEMVCKFKKGFKSDGASAPLFAQKFLPDVKVGDDVYNAAPFIHDGLYMWKGCVDGFRLNREECDDILRGTWRCSGVGRIVAGIADVGIQLFAGAESHWGDDSLNCKHCFEISMRYV